MTGRAQEIWFAVTVTPPAEQLNPRVYLDDVARGARGWVGEMDSAGVEAVVNVRSEFRIQPGDTGPDVKDVAVLTVRLRNQVAYLFRDEGEWFRLIGRLVGCLASVTGGVVESMDMTAPGGAW